MNEEIWGLRSLEGRVSYAGLLVMKQFEVEQQARKYRKGSSERAELLVEARDAYQNLLEMLSSPDYTELDELGWPNTRDETANYVKERLTALYDPKNPSRFAPGVVASRGTPQWRRLFHPAWYVDNEAGDSWREYFFDHLKTHNSRCQEPITGFSSKLRLPTYRADLVKYYQTFSVLDVDLRDFYSTLEDEQSARMLDHVLKSFDLESLRDLVFLDRGDEHCFVFSFFSAKKKLDFNRSWRTAYKNVCRPLREHCLFVGLHEPSQEPQPAFLNDSGYSRKPPF